MNFRAPLTWALALVLLLMLVSGCGDDDKNFTTPPPAGTPGEAGPIQEPGETFWYHDQVFYEVFVRSFYDSNGDGKGDLQGLIQKLDYLNDGNPDTDTDLGVTVLWLMPINQSPSYHGYDTSDYRTVELDYGNNADFQELMAQAHARGMRVIIDYVMNHCSSQHSWFTTALSNPDDPYRQWFRWSSTYPGYSGPWGQTVWHNSSSGYYYGIFWSGMPDLNYENPDVVAEMKETARFWLQDMGADGFRLDAVKYIIEDGQLLQDTPSTLAFWEDFTTYCSGVEAESFLVGEAWDSSSVVLQYIESGFDTCFEFDLAGRILNAVSSANAAGLKGKVQDLVDDFPYHRYATFLTNHDQNRVASELAQDSGRLKSAAAIYLTLPGVPFLYYGEEVGMIGTKPDENIRRPMQWTSGANAGFTTGTPWHSVNYNYQTYNVETMAADPSSLWNWYRRLIQARTTSAALRRGTYQELGTTSSALFGFLRVDQDSGDAVIALHNVAAGTMSGYRVAADQTQLAPGQYTCENLLGGNAGATLTVGEGGRIESWAPSQSLGARESQLYRLVSQ